jgi:hypothetical protein
MAGTVGACSPSEGVTLGVDDVSVPSGDTPLTDGMTVQVVRNGVGEVGGGPAGRTTGGDRGGPRAAARAS